MPRMNGLMWIICADYLRDSRMGMTFICTQEKNALFYMHKLLLYEARTGKMQILDFSRQIPITL